MKIAFLSLLVLALALVYVSLPSPSPAQADAKSEPSPESADGPAGFAVVELFTSQGCSSCPPADRVLGDLTRHAQEHDLPIYALSHHVDYWDGLGWPDPYASSEATQRQREYARTFRSNRIYTPQMIVNGRAEFVGSRKSRAEHEVRKALDTSAAWSLDIEGLHRQGNTLQVDLSAVSLEPNIAIALQADTTLLVAVVEPTRSNEVHRGENRGRHLEHVGVVRVFVQAPVSEAGLEAKLDLPEDIARRSYDVVAFLQSGNTGPILAATQRHVPQPKAASR